MFKSNLFSKVLASISVVAFVGPVVVRADSLSLVTAPSSQQTNDSINWSQVGADQTLLNAGGSVLTVKGKTVQVSLAAANSVLSVACSATPCSWTGIGATQGDTLLWTSDAGGGGNGPVSVSFPSPMAGAGAVLQADGPGQFTAKIEAFNGGTSLGSFTVPSDSQGRPVYIGVLDQSGSNITSVVFSLTSVTGGITSDFALDTVNLTTALAAPAVSLLPASLNFGNQPVGTTGNSQSITLKNTGNAPLAITSIVASGDFKQTNNCGSSLGTGLSCAIAVAFHPTVAGTRTGAITITDNAKPGPQTASLAGVGTAPVVHFSATSLAFAPQLLGTKSGLRTVTLSNTGNAPLNFSSIVATGDFGQGNNCVSPLAAGASCTISVSFHPTVVGSRTGAITVTDNAAGSPQSVTLSGVGTEVKLSATTSRFPATLVGKVSASQTVTLTNVGTTALSITSVSLAGTNPADFSEMNTCGSSVAAGASCTITMAFQPKAIGTRSATLSIADNGGASPQSVTLSGIGTEVKLSATTLTFPATTVGKISASQAVTLTNVGTTALSITSVSLAGTNPADFSETNTCGSSVAAGASCTITMAFQPKATGTRSAILSIADNGGASPQQVKLTGTGQ